jgi:hypothetical protein
MRGKATRAQSMASSSFKSDVKKALNDLLSSELVKAPECYLVSRFHRDLCITKIIESFRKNKGEYK